jgi:hypothetical protein
LADHESISDSRPATITAALAFQTFGDLMISTHGGITAQLLPLNAALFNCFDPIDDEGADLVRDKPKMPETVFDGTGYGSDTFEEPEAGKTKKLARRATGKKPAAVIEPLDGKLSDEQRVEFYTRAYEPSEFDKAQRIAAWNCTRLTKGSPSECHLRTKVTPLQSSARLKANSQSAISVGVTWIKARAQAVGKHNVAFAEEVDLRELSLVGEGCCHQAYASLIDANDSPSLKASVNSPSFKLESVAHNLRTTFRKKMRTLEALTERITALQQMPQPVRSMTVYDHNALDTQRIQQMQNARRAQLRNM